MSSIFWSWQSDLDARVTRSFIRDALAQAILELDAELDERHELTSDTQGIAGSPDIVATILAKIAAAKVFVGDVTPLAISPSGKALANPNVLIELGYAKSALGLERVILIWNTAFEGATIDNLPFDMRGRRAPISFRLPPDASTKELREERERLSKILREALRLSVAVATPDAALAWHSEGETPGLWFDAEKPVTINEDGRSGTKAMASGPYRYVRILPRAWARKSEAEDIHARPVILGPTCGYSWGKIKGGTLVYTGSLRSGQETSLRNMVMQFHDTGELWGVDPFVANGEDGNRFYADATISHFYKFIKDNMRVLAAQNSKGPYEIIMGISDVSGLHWVSETRWGGNPIALEDSAEARFTLDGADENRWLEALLPAWGKIAQAFGVDQPSREVMRLQIRDCH